MGLLNYITSINLKIKGQKWEATSVYLKSPNCYLGHRFREKPKLGSNGRIFMRKGREIMTWVEERNFHRCQQATKLLFSCAWFLLILKSVHSHHPCGPVSSTVVCKTMLIWPKLKVIFSVQMRQRFKDQGI